MDSLDLVSHPLKRSGYELIFNMLALQTYECIEI